MKRALPTAGMKRADPQRVRKEHSQLQARNEDQNDVMDGKRSFSTDKVNDIAMEVGRNPRLVRRC